MRTNMRYIKKLPDISEIIDKYPLSPEDKRKRELELADISRILSGEEHRKILIIGPCSADCEKSVIEYAIKLRRLQDEVKNDLLIIPRVYTSKPRTKGTGYKGLLHRPQASSEHDDIISGVVATRKMHQSVIKNSGFFTADEMLYPEMHSYISDLLVYTAVGARSVENQQHRLTASGLDMPVGMKNPTSGDYKIMLNAIIASQNAQTLMYNGWEVETEGNKYAHAILRGYIDNAGIARPNYHYEDIRSLYDMYYKENLENTSVIIDCNHCNSNKHYNEQPRIVEEVLDTCKRNKSMNRFIKGFMVESYLVDGAQLVGGGTYGQSITDSCLGWDKTERLVMNIAERLSLK